MVTTEAEATSWIYSFSANKSGRCLDHLHEILTKLDDPHKKLKTIHIAGTNGKGSTVAFMREGLMQAGYKVATFTSPFITCFGERMSINNTPMSEVDLVKYTNIIKSSLPSTTCEYTSFDIITLISFLYFVEATVDIAIYETGIGGRLDSTNVILPLVSAITNVGHDHAEVLGDTQLERALEKLGIVKEKVPLFTTEEDPDLLAEFDKICQGKNAYLHQPLKNAEFKFMSPYGVCFDCREYKNIIIRMSGEHQFKNAVLAITILEYLRFADDFGKIHFPPRVTNATWQGRFEHVQEEPAVVLDGAHNLESIQSLTNTLKLVYPDQKKRFLFSAIATKDAKKMIEILSEIAEGITFTKGTNPESIAPEVLAQYYNGLFDPMYGDYEKAIELELEKLKDDEVLVICGSLYFISDVRRYLLEKG